MSTNGKHISDHDRELERGDSACAIAFSQGSDARVNGVDITRNPYRDLVEVSDWWTAGWIHCDRYFGVDAKWPVRRLPFMGER